MTRKGPKGPQSSKGILIDTLHSCITEQEIPLTGAATPEKLDQEFQLHCARRLASIDKGLFHLMGEEEEISITSK